MAVHIDPTGAHVTIPDSDGNPLPVDSSDPTVIRLTSAGGSQATVFAGTGFNVVDWRVPVAGVDVPLLHHDADVLSGGSGTRSGVPILFPFPNRIAGASFEAEGRTYRLPVAHPGDPHAIHGFCAKRPWSQIEATGDSAVTGTFRLSRDAREVAADWPGDLELAVTVHLADDALRLDSRVTNVGDRPAPFGLGFHPYFSLLAAADLADVELQVPADRYWELVDSIPTGALVEVSGDRDLREPVTVGDREWDDVLTDLPAFVPGADGLMERARIRGGDVTVALRCDAAFRDMVVFTPANRKALAVEPYTCPTDAVHLSARGLEVGWRTLAPRESWTATVEFAVGFPVP